LNQTLYQLVPIYEEAFASPELPDRDALVWFPSVFCGLCNYVFSTPRRYDTSGEMLLSLAKRLRKKFGLGKMSPQELILEMLEVKDDEALEALSRTFQESLRIEIAHGKILLDEIPNYQQHGARYWFGGPIVMSELTLIPMSSKPMPTFMTIIDTSTLVIKEELLQLLAPLIEGTVDVQEASVLDSKEVYIEISSTTFAALHHEEMRRCPRCGSFKYVSDPRKARCLWLEGRHLMFDVTTRTWLCDVVIKEVIDECCQGQYELIPICHTKQICGQDELLEATCIPVSS